METKPTVSQLLDVLNKPALLRWANKIGLEGVHLDDYRKDSTKRGTDIHSNIKDYLKDNLPFEHPGIQAEFEKFISNKKVLGIEEKIETEWFKGRYDIKLLIEDKIYLCDFKSSNKVYFENKLQLVMYSMAEKSDCLAIIEIPSFRLRKIEILNLEKYQKIVKCLSYIYTTKKELEN